MAGTAFKDRVDHISIMVSIEVFASNNDKNNNHYNVIIMMMIIILVIKIMIIQFIYKEFS